MQLGDNTLSIDISARVAFVNGTPLRLQRKDFDTLAKLTLDPSKIVTPTELAVYVYSATLATAHYYVRPQSRVLDSRISRVRSELRNAGLDGYPTNVWGIGWRFLPDAALAPQLDAALIGKARAAAQVRQHATG